MKKVPYLLAGFLVLMVACKKDSPSSASRDVTLTYEVITTSGTWFGEYNDQSGTRINTKPTEQAPVLQSGWKFNFKPQSHPFEMFINASSTCICMGTPTSPDVTINLYVDGNLVKTATNNWTKGQAAISYDVQ